MLLDTKVVDVWIKVTETSNDIYEIRRKYQSDIIPCANIESTLTITREELDLIMEAIK